LAVGLVDDDCARVEVGPDLEMGRGHAALIIQLRGRPSCSAPGPPLAFKALVAFAAPG